MNSDGALSVHCPQHISQVLGCQGDAAECGAHVRPRHMQKYCAPQTRNDRRIIVAKNNNHVVEMIPSHQLLSTCRVGKPDGPIVGCVTAFITPSIPRANWRQAKRSSGWVDAVTAIENAPQRVRACWRCAIAFPADRDNSVLPQRTGKHLVADAQSACVWFCTVLPNINSHGDSLSGSLDQRSRRHSLSASQR